MWEMMNGMTSGMRNRLMPRRQGNGIGTITAVVLGASVGIAAWETYRRTRMNGNESGGMGKIADQVINGLGDE